MVMRPVDPDDPARENRKGNLAAVNLAVALLLLLAVGAVRLRATLTDGAGLLLLSAVGVLALISAGLLCRSLLRR